MPTALRAAEEEAVVAVVALPARLIPAVRVVEPRLIRAAQVVRGRRLKMGRRPANGRLHGLQVGTLLLLPPMKHRNRWDNLCQCHQFLAPLASNSTPPKQFLKSSPLIVF